MMFGPLNSKTYFAVDGRMPLSDFWATILFILPVGTAINYLIARSIGYPLFVPRSFTDKAAFLETIHQQAVFQFWISFIWLLPMSLVYLKRLHDRGHSGWWLLPFNVLLYGDLIYRLSARPNAAELNSNGFWRDGSPVYFGRIEDLILLLMLPFLIEIGFLRGTAGPNRYGPDPLDVTRVD